jgi:[ribosomal protein S18]-alanine N-acetyltransferase
MAIRWMIRRDLPTVAKIESESFSAPWSQDEFFRALLQRNTIGMVYDSIYQTHPVVAYEVIGYMIYTFNRNTLTLDNLAVSPGFRRDGIGREMLVNLARKLNTTRRKKIVADVSEVNLNAQLFLRACGFKATKILPGDPAELSDDGYRFELPFEAAQALTDCQSRKRA